MAIDIDGMWREFLRLCNQNFVAGNRWKFITDGLRNTLLITLFALILGLLIGFTVALVRVTFDTTGRLKPLNALTKLYVTVIRGTPMVLQLLIIYYVIFRSVNIDKIFVAILGFGINSGAYVSEIFRAGIMSVDTGQMEAGRSLGLNYNQTMWRVIMPQAIKNVLPAIGNECITLLKETSIAGYIAVQDLTMGANIIRSLTYEPFFPLVGAAVIYLALVMLLQAGVGALERRLAKSDRR